MQDYIDYDFIAPKTQDIYHVWIVWNFVKLAEVRTEPDLKSQGRFRALAGAIYGSLRLWATQTIVSKKSRRGGKVFASLMNQI